MNTTWAKMALLDALDVVQRSYVFLKPQPFASNLAESTCKLLGGISFQPETRTLEDIAKSIMSAHGVEQSDFTMPYNKVCSPLTIVEDHTNMGWYEGNHNSRSYN